MSNIYKKHNVYFGLRGLEELNRRIKQNLYSSVFVLVDQNTEFHCLDFFKKSLEAEIQIICIAAGEEFKNIQTCLDIWQKLSDKGADRNSLLISLGGGVVTDIGGFVASCFKRGISFIHIPTSLLGMVDAAIGGKNGVDLNTLKNQIGIIRPPEMIIIDNLFLKTLPAQEIKSGYAEMIKHGLIHSDSYFESCISNENMISALEKLIKQSVSIKLHIVEEDINEKGLRKALNYGHTLGHAIESYRMSQDTSKHLLHGEAIAIGLVLESFISFKRFGFSKNRVEELKSYVHKVYPFIEFDKAEQEEIIELLKHDKKNTNGNVNFVLLRNIGSPEFDCMVDNELIYQSFEFYQQKN